MAKITDIHNPSFSLYPVNNNRTAWRPFGLPVILTVPHKRDPGGVTLANGGIFSVRIFIEDVPREARVAGHQHIGMRFPDKELYAVTIDALALADRLINLQDVQITKADGTAVDLNAAQDNDIILYTTATGIHDTIPYLVGADYYDLSDILIDVELLPSDRYNLVYQAEYFKRIVSQDGRNSFLCIDGNSKSLAILRFQIDHPGKLLDEFYRLTPPPYLTTARKSQDTTVALYRPFTDMLQDVMDEQDLLERINWVFDVPAEAIPYLSSLLGWDIPYFPESLDKLRRAVLRRTVELQNLKGSRRAIINIFRLFGFEILISNLWWSADGRRFIRPDERLPFGYQDQEIVTVQRNQVDTLLDNYTVTNFAVFQIPLLYRPQEKTGLDRFTALHDGGQVTVAVYAVTDGSPAHLTLQALAAQSTADPAGFGDKANCRADTGGFLFPHLLQDALAGKELAGFSLIHITGGLGLPVDETLVGPAIPATRAGVRLLRNTNELSLTLNGFTQFSGLKLYAFAIYRRYEFKVPPLIAHLQSNRFDIQVLTQALDEFADPVTLEFAVEFLFRLKAFHSLLNVIRTRIELTETYEVTDLCVGGDFEQRFDTDIGRLQVPPAIIPRIPGDLNDCALLDPRELGYKDSDILLRIRKLTNLPEEHEAWRLLDGRDPSPQGETRIAPTSPAHTITGGTRDSCKFNPAGQDRLTVQERVEIRDIIRGPSPNANMGDAGYPDGQLSPVDAEHQGNYDESGRSGSSNSDSGAYGPLTREHTQVRDAFCILDKVHDYCYKGRVDDEILYRPTVVEVERGGIRPAYIGLGLGVYWLYPTISRVARPGIRHPDPRSQTKKISFSGGAPETGLTYYQKDQQDYLTVPYDRPLPRLNNTFLGRLYRDYDAYSHNRWVRSQTLHFSNRRGEPIVDQRLQLALQRPSLQLQKPWLHFPGCRFARLNALTANFTHPTWSARPWDQEPCGPLNVCGQTEPDYLNFRMTIGTDGNDKLVFDDQPYQISGNNLDPDIPVLGDQTLGTDALVAATDVVHKVYMSNASGNPAVVLDGVCDLDTAVAAGTIDTTRPLFDSHNQCVTDPSQYTDYADGYPCMTGYSFITPSDSSAPFYPDVLQSLGMPPVDTSPIQVLFLLSSGIRVEKGYRLDGGCLALDCDAAASPNTLCAMDSYNDEDGLLDIEPDHLLLETRLKLDEKIDIMTIMLDGTIPSLIEVLTG
jgi:hypothetical protein